MPFKGVKVAPTTMEDMRGWLIIFLLVMTPLQFSWAAIGVYCQHEKGIATQHLGHHGHQHQLLSNDQLTAEQLKSGSFDADCGTCHIGCSLAIASTAETPCLATKRVNEARTQQMPVSPPFKVPDRPQWLVKT
jgi:hypothetical protein